MSDVHSPAVRRRNMQAIRSKNTRPEIKVRKILHALGYRFRLHAKNLPSSPDIVLPKYNAIILVHGCFWHGHNCHLFKSPATHTSLWMEKIHTNQQRDARQIKELENLGYRILVVWECSIKGKCRLTDQQLGEELTRWIVNGSESSQISCRFTSNS